jgi:parallel beta-helix repeat protein
VVGSNYNDFSENLIEKCDHGMSIISSDNNKFHENVISECSPTVGILIQDSNDNLFYKNSFLNNVVHIYVLSGTNFFNSSEIGNYWDNYTGSDPNNDGIGTPPHTFSGGIDYLPIWDDSPPIITFITPINDTRLGYLMNNFIIEIKEPYIDKMWYEFAGDSTRFYFTSNGTFDPTAWDNLWASPNDGDPILIYFYANDTWGYTTEETLTIIQDTIPELTIVSPINGTKLGRIAPSFQIEVVDYNISTMKYTIDGGLTNYNFTENGAIDQTAWQTLWDTLANGDTITLTFFVEDHIGQITSDSIQLLVNKPPGPPSGGEIPGYDLIVLINILSILLTILIIKRKRAIQ